LQRKAFIPHKKGCLLDCLDWVPNRGACIDDSRYKKPCNGRLIMWNALWFWRWYPYHSLPKDFSR